MEVELESFATQEISLVLGAEESLMDCKNTAYKFSKITNCKQELTKCKNWWKDILRKITSLYSTRIYKYTFKWMGKLSNIGK